MTAVPAITVPTRNLHAVDETAPFALPPAPRPRRRTLVAIMVIGVVILGSAFSVAYASQSQDREALVAATIEHAARPLRVTVTHPALPAEETGIQLPGNIDALKTTVIYAQTNGYVKQRLVDIGDRVTEGQLLAVIEAPEVAAQLAQARAALAQSKATRAQASTNLEFARISLERIKPLAPAGVASQQDLDQRQAEHQAGQANLVAADANIDASQANVRRLVEMEKFSRVVAPFAGTITERDIEVGSLITFGSGTGQALFKMAQSNPVRVFASVPQSLAPEIKTGMSATVTVREYPGRMFVGKVTRDAGALDLASRTLLTEVQVPNDDGALLQGMYAGVSFSTQRAKPPLVLDSSALSVTADGVRVAMIRDGKIHLQPITIEADLGSQITVSEGVDATDSVVLNPDSRLKEGMSVEAIDAKPVVAVRGIH